MYKEITKIVPLLLIPFLSFSKSEKHNIHRYQKSEYPYVLLTDDYGILNGEDMAINTCDRYPTKISEEDSSNLYWQCFETKNAKILCEKSGNDASTGVEMSFMTFEIESSPKIFRYVTGHNMESSNCLFFKKKWIKAVKNEKHVCFSGSFNSVETDEKYKLSSNWQFDKFKTKRGCTSYFYGHCSLSYLVKNGCIL